jgi:glycosyltransferase involved in cell wall biosynthesis
MMMRVAIITHYFPPHVGGIEALASEQSTKLVEIGHIVIVISSKTRNEPGYECLYGYMIYRIPALNILEHFWGIPYPIFHPSYLNTLNKVLLESDVCIIHSMGFLSSFLAAFSCFRIGIPYIVIQNNQFIKYPNPLLNLIQHINDKSAGRYVLSHASCIFAVSTNTQKYIKNLVGKEVEILSNPVNTNDFSPSNDKAIDKVELGFPVDKFLVLTCGRLVYKRSIETFIETANLLKDDDRFYFVVVGDGPNKKKYEKYIHRNNIGNCLLVGEIPHKVMSKYYRAADIFVLTSKTGEGWPISIMEAWATGVPVITTSLGEGNEKLKPGNNCFLTDPSSPEQIVNILDCYINKPDVLEAIGNSGRELIFRELSVDIYTKKLENILLKCEQLRIKY